MDENVFVPAHSNHTSEGETLYYGDVYKYVQNKIYLKCNKYLDSLLKTKKPSFSLSLPN